MTFTQSLFGALDSNIHLNDNCKVAQKLITEKNNSSSATFGETCNDKIIINLWQYY